MELLNEKILIGLSGGINSMAVLCNLVESGIKPAEVHLFYAHFAEHSPDTFRFVADGIRYARKNFPCVKVKITSNSILRFFEQAKMIPHPSVSPCTKFLKIYAINKYAFDHDIKIDLVGYVKHELKRRVGGQKKAITPDLFSLAKLYTIGQYTDEWCFEIVKRHIGYWPKIYDILWDNQDYIEGLCSSDEMGTRVFKHNNCLPCKNMYPRELLAIKRHYPEYYIQAMRTAAIIKSFYGRNEAEFYSTFGRDLGQESTCETCKF